MSLSAFYSEAYAPPALCFVNNAYKFSAKTSYIQFHVYVGRGFLIVYK